MMRTTQITIGVLAISISMFTGCGKQQQTASGSASLSNQSDSQSEQERRRALVEAMAYADKEYQEKLHHPELATNIPPSEWPFPNYQTGPGRPLPPCVNFYSMNDPYPAYLLCEYQVDEEHYNQSDEPKWFEASLEQIRGSGAKKFPPIKWIAVIIENRAGWTGASTFEQAHKVGAIFKASDVFSPSCDLSQLVAHADMDRHPFKYDTSQPTPGEQQRWLIVEKQAAKLK